MATPRVPRFFQVYLAFLGIPPVSHLHIERLIMVFEMPNPSLNFFIVK